MAPQLFQVLRCYKCETFQVHQVKKSNKWECKMCGEGQSVKRHYGIGTGKDCRLHVQKLNGMQGAGADNIEDVTSDSEDLISNNITSSATEIKSEANIVSKWHDFIEKEEKQCDPHETDSNIYVDDVQVVLEVPKKRKCLRKGYKREVTNEGKVISNLKKPTMINKTNENKNILLCKNTLDLSPYKTQHNPKWAQYCDDDNDTESNCHEGDVFNTNDHTNNDRPSFNTESLIETVKCDYNLVTNKSKDSLKKQNNSKWVQYINDEDESNIFTSSHNNNSDKTTFFSLSDETDIDDILQVNI